MNDKEFKDKCIKYGDSLYNEFGKRYLTDNLDEIISIAIRYLMNWNGTISTGEEKEKFIDAIKKAGLI